MISAAKLGDVDAFGLLFERNKDAVYSFVARSVGRREDAEDIVQDVFLRAWRSIERFRGDSALTTWLCSIAANRCRDYYRSAQRRVTPETDLRFGTTDIESVEEPAGDVESTSVTKETVSDALGKLNISQRMLVVLCDVQGFTYKEAAEIVGCSQVSVKVMLHRARKKLRTLLAGVLDQVD